MDSKTIATSTLAHIETYYPQYLHDVGLNDHPIVKISFYEVMIKMIEDGSLSDDKAQALVLHALRRYAMNRRTALALAMHREHPSN